MTTLLMIFGHPRGSGLGVTQSLVQSLPVGAAEVVTCSDCPVQKAGTVVVESADGQLSMVSYEDRYGDSGPAAPAELLPYLPKGGAAYRFDSIEASRSWYQAVKDQLGLHVAYFFDNTESPIYAAG